MFKSLETYLEAFRPCFKNKAAFEWFILLVIGFILRYDALGVTSIIRVMLIHGGSYENLLHFFYATSWRLDSLRTAWYRVVKHSGLLWRFKDRIVLAGDGVKQSKEAYYMPGVKKLHQESEDSSKGEYIFGHLFGAVGAIIGKSSPRFCLPLRMGIHDGLQAAAKWEGSPISDQSHVVQMIENGYEVSRSVGRSLLLLDRYFLSVPALKRFDALNASAGGKKFDIVTKAKWSCVAFEKPGPKTGKRGRPKKKGAKIKLTDLFKHPDVFHKCSVMLYGKETEVTYLSKDLLWGPGLYKELRFVLVEYNGMQSILVSTDLSLSPEDIIYLYSIRFKIECCFREFKQQMGGFGYHFWTKSLEKLNHFKAKDAADNLSSVTSVHDREMVLKTIRAIECFVHLSCIAMGIVQMLAASVEDSQEVLSYRYLRTNRNELISEATMLVYLRQHFFAIMAMHPLSFITQIILRRQAGPDAEILSA